MIDIAIVDAGAIDFTIIDTGAIDFSIEIVDANSDIAVWLFNQGKFDRNGTFFRDKTFKRS